MTKAIYLASRISPSISSNSPAVQNVYFVSCCSCRQTAKPPSVCMLSRRPCVWNARVLGLSWPGADPWTSWELALLWFASLWAFQALKVLAAVARTLDISIYVGTSMVAFLMSPICTSSVRPANDVFILALTLCTRYLDRSLYY